MDVQGTRRHQITAFHEAAHAVVALVHPKARKPVWVELEGDRGSTILDPSVDTTSLTEEQVYAECVVASAGNWAEVLFFGGEADFQTFTCGDLQTASELAQANLSEVSALETIEEADKKAEQWVRENRTAIEKVAKELIRVGSMDEAKIREVALGSDEPE